MKKILLSIALMIGAGAIAFAQTPQAKPATEPAKTTQVTAPAPPSYMTVKIDELNAKVQTAVKAFESSYTVKQVSLDKAKEIAKVELVLKADNKTEKIVYLDKEGKETPEPKK